MTPQRVRCRVMALESDACHPRVRTVREALFILLGLATLLFLCVTPARAQSGASLQVAARVVSTEASRAALALTAAALRSPVSALRQSGLAQVAVSPAPRSADAVEPRRVRVDFLRN